MSSSGERDLYESLAEIYSIIITLDGLEKAYIKDVAVSDTETERVEERPICNTAVDTMQRAVVAQSAYPRIQPMKAAFYFDSVEGFGDCGKGILAGLVRGEKRLDLFEEALGGASDEEDC